MQLKSQINTKMNTDTTRKVSLFGVFLVRLSGSLNLDIKFSPMEQLFTKTIAAQEYVFMISLQHRCIDQLILEREASMVLAMKPVAHLDQ